MQSQATNFFCAEASFTTALVSQGGNYEQSFDEGHHLLSDCRNVHHRNGAECGCRFFALQAVTGTQNRADEIVKIQKALETKLVSESLEKMGYTAEEIKLRLGEMSDEQLHQVATRLDDIRVAGDGLGVLIAVLLIAVLVLLILYLTGHRVLVQ